MTKLTSDRSQLEARAKRRALAELADVAGGGVPVRDLWAAWRERLLVRASMRCLAQAHRPTEPSRSLAFSLVYSSPTPLAFQPGKLARSLRLMAKAVRLAAGSRSPMAVNSSKGDSTSNRPEMINRAFACLNGIAMLLERDVQRLNGRESVCRASRSSGWARKTAAPVRCVISKLPPISFEIISATPDMVCEQGHTGRGMGR